MAKLRRSGPSPVEPDGADRLVDALAQVAFATMAVLNKVSADHELSLTQLRVLAILRDRRLRMAALADHLGLEKSTMTGLIDRAEKRGLVERAASQADGRSVEVFLSRAGTQLAERLTARVRESLSPLTNQLTRPEAHQVRRLMERMVMPGPSGRSDS
jgi:DNA-binding MarR family transcriptional regulator